MPALCRRGRRSAGAARSLRPRDPGRDLPGNRQVITAQWTALLWLDWRLLVNRIRTIARNPRRFVPWLIFLVWLLPSFITRLTFRNRIGNQDFFPSLGSQIAPLGVLIPGVALLVLGISIWRASITAPAAF